MFFFVSATSVTQYPNPIFIKYSKEGKIEVQGLDVEAGGWQRTEVGEFFLASVKWDEHPLLGSPWVW